MLSQRDPRWAGHKIGSTQEIIGQYGCTLTCLAQVLGSRPDAVADKLYQVSGLSGAYIIWQKLDVAFPDLHFVWRDYAYSQSAVDRTIASQGFCLVEVDFDHNPRSPGRHWILLTKDGSLDPWTGGLKEYPLKTGYAIIEKRKPEPIPEPPIIEDNEMTDEMAKKLIDAIKMQNLLVFMHGDIQFVKPDPNKKECYLKKGKRLILIDNGSMIDNGLAWSALGK
jgi:hypothetical protein